MLGALIKHCWDHIRFWLLVIAAIGLAATAAEFLIERVVPLFGLGPGWEMVAGGVLFVGVLAAAAWLHDRYQLWWFIRRQI